MVLEGRLHREKPYPGGGTTADHRARHRHFIEVLGRFDESFRVHSTPERLIHAGRIALLTRKFVVAFHSSLESQYDALPSARNVFF